MPYIKFIFIVVIYLVSGCSQISTKDVELDVESQNANKYAVVNDLHKKDVEVLSVDDEVSAPSKMSKVSQQQRNQKISSTGDSDQLNLYTPKFNSLGNVSKPKLKVDTGVKKFQPIRID